MDDVEVVDSLSLKARKKADFDYEMGRVKSPLDFISKTGLCLVFRFFRLPSAFTESACLV